MMLPYVVDVSCRLVRSRAQYNTLNFPHVSRQVLEFLLASIYLLHPFTLVQSCTAFRYFIMFLSIPTY